MNGTIMNETIVEELICDYREPGDTAWLLSSGVLVMTMQGGFAMLESGSVRVNNAVNILVKNIFDLGLGGIGYWMIGWGFAYGKSSGGFIGTDQFFPDSGLDYASWFFQFSFAATASTIDSGACCERMNLFVYFGLSFFMTCFSYPVTTHWVWHEDGWLFKMGFVDLAGVTVVHCLGGASAFVCTKYLGPRMGVLSEIPKELQCVKKQLELSHKVFHGEAVHLLFGALLLCFGWIGFNSGSSLSLTAGGHLMAGHIAFTTVLGACWGLCAGTALSAYLHPKRLLVPAEIGTALLAGLVSVTGGAHVMTAIGASMSAVIGSIIAILSMKLNAKLKIDDPVGVLPVHFYAGLWGAVAPAFFAKEVPCAGIDGSTPGIFYGGPVSQLGVQILGTFVICVWGAAWTWFYLLFVQYVLRVNIRLSPVHELVGADVLEHGIDLFKRISCQQEMQEMMRKINPNRTKTRTQISRSYAASSHAGSSVDSGASKGNLTRGASQTKVAPAEGSAFLKVNKKRKTVEQRSDDARVSLANSNNIEALAWATANIDELPDDDDDQAAQVIASSHQSSAPLE